MGRFFGEIDEEMLDEVDEKVLGSETRRLFGI